MAISMRGIRGKLEWQNHYDQTGIKREIEFKDHASQKITQRRIKECIKYGNIKPSDIVLSLGCGSGEEFIFLKDAGIKNVIGVDFSINLLKSAQNRNSIIVQCDAECLPFKEVYFDKIICINLVECLDSPTKGLKEMRRVLKKDGFVIVVTPNLGAAFIHRFGPPSGTLYTIKELTSFFKENNFNELNIVYFNFIIRKIPKVISVLNEYLGKFLEKSFLKKYAKDILITGKK